MGTCTGVAHSRFDSSFIRCVIIVCRYMAPEVLTLKSCSVTKGYTASIDFWSLGVTVFKLLSGRLPFEKSDLYKFSKFSGFKDKTSRVSRTFS